MGPKNLGSKNSGPKNLGPKSLASKNLGPKNLGPKNLGPKNLGPKNWSKKFGSIKLVSSSRSDVVYTIQMLIGIVILTNPLWSRGMISAMKEKISIVAAQG